MIAPRFNGHDERPAPRPAPAKPALAKMLLTPKEAAALLSIGERKLWSLTAGGEIAHVRIGRAVRYTPADLEAFIRRQREAG